MNIQAQKVKDSNKLIKQIVKNSVLNIRLDNDVIELNTKDVLKNLISNYDFFEENDIRFDLKGNVKKDFIGKISEEDKKNFLLGRLSYFSKNNIILNVNYEPISIIELSKSGDKYIVEDGIESLIYALNNTDTDIYIKNKNVLPKSIELEESENLEILDLFNREKIDFNIFENDLTNKWMYADDLETFKIGYNKFMMFSKIEKEEFFKKYSIGYDFIKNIFKLYKNELKVYDTKRNSLELKELVNLFYELKSLDWKEINNYYLEVAMRKMADSNSEKEVNDKFIKEFMDEKESINMEFFDDFAIKLFDNNLFPKIESEIDAKLVPLSNILNNKNSYFSENFLENTNTNIKNNNEKTLLEINCNNIDNEKILMVYQHIFQPQTFNRILISLIEKGDILSEEYFNNIFTKNFYYSRTNTFFVEKMLILQKSVEIYDKDFMCDEKSFNILKYINTLMSLNRLIKEINQKNVSLLLLAKNNIDDFNKLSLNEKISYYPISNFNYKTLTFFYKNIYDLLDINQDDKKISVNYLDGYTLKEFELDFLKNIKKELLTKSIKEIFKDQNPELENFLSKTKDYSSLNKISYLNIDNNFKSYSENKKLEKTEIFDLIEKFKDREELKIEVDYLLKNTIKNIVESLDSYDKKDKEEIVLKVLDLAPEKMLSELKLNKNILKDVSKIFDLHVFSKEEYNFIIKYDNFYREKNQIKWDEFKEQKIIEGYLKFLTNPYSEYFNTYQLKSCVVKNLYKLDTSSLSEKEMKYIVDLAIDSVTDLNSANKALSIIPENEYVKIVEKLNGFNLYDLKESQVKKFLSNEKIVNALSEGLIFKFIKFAPDILKNKNVREKYNINFINNIKNESVYLDEKYIKNPLNCLKMLSMIEVGYVNNGNGKQNFVDSFILKVAKTHFTDKLIQIKIGNIVDKLSPEGYRSMIELYPNKMKEEKTHHLFTSFIKEVILHNNLEANNKVNKEVIQRKKI